MKPDDYKYFTLVFEGDIGKLKVSPMNTKTPFGKPVAAGRGDAFDEIERLREFEWKYNDLCD